MMNAACYSGIGGGMCKYASSSYGADDHTRTDTESLRVNKLSSYGEKELMELRRKSMRRFSQNPNNCNTVLFNIGGTRFETYNATIKSLPTCKLANEAFLDRYYRSENNEYFFDRDPDKFKIILNYLRTGELHLPTNICGPALKYELDFWGIDEGDIEMCCWPVYNTWHAQSKSLEKLESDMKITTTQDMKFNDQTASIWKKIQFWVWDVLHNPESSIVAKVYAGLSVIAVLISVFSFCVESHPYFRVSPEKDIRPVMLHHNSTENHTVPHPALIIIDYYCLAFFTIEFIARAMFSPIKCHFVASPLNIIDFITIMPDYIELLMFAIKLSSNQRAEQIVKFIFIIRIMRLCRIFRLIRHVPGLWILMYTLKASLKELLLMAVFLLIGMVIFASVIYYAENTHDFTNIPIGFWWSVVTMTTVGYGDLYPKTGPGYLIGSVCAMMGLLMIAFTVPIIVGNFVLYYTHVQHGISRRAKKLSSENLTARYDWLFSGENNDHDDCDVTNGNLNQQNVDQSQARKDDLISSTDIGNYQEF